MFDFVVMMKDAVPDPTSTFGIFEKNPENITLLPGLKHAFAKFIEKVKNIGKTNSSSISLGVEKKSKTSFKAKTAFVKKQQRQ